MKVVLDLPSYATKKELGHATGVNTSDLAGKKSYCVEGKAKVDILIHLL